MQLRTFRLRARIVAAHSRVRMHGMRFAYATDFRIRTRLLSLCPPARVGALVFGGKERRAGAVRTAGGTIMMGSRAQGGLIYKDSVLVLLLRIVASSLCFSDMQVGSGLASALLS